MVADLALLLGGLLQQSLGDDKGHIFTGDPELLETVLDPTNGVSDELESRAVKQALLHAGDEAESRRLADFADLAEKAEVENQFVVLATAQEVQQLVENEEETLLGVLLLELRHHLVEEILVA